MPNQYIGIGRDGNTGTRISWDGKDEYNPFPNGTDGDYVPPVVPNSTYVTPSFSIGLFRAISVNLSSDEPVEFF
jgi:hypothetical protein